MTHLVNSCVTMNKFMDKFCANTELIYVIYEHCSKLSSKSSKAKFEKHQSVLKPPMNLIIFLQRSEYNGVRDEYYKNKTKIPFRHNITCRFQVETMKWFILWYQSSFMLVKIWKLVTTSVMYWNTAQERGVIVMVTQ